MNRRMFASQLSAGLALQLMWASPTAGFSLSVPPPDQSLTDPTDRAADWVRDGLLGTPQRLTLTHIYSPALTSLPALLTIARPDFDRAGRLIGSALSVDAQRLLADSPSAAFGSYSARFDSAGTTVVWQGLARIGLQASVPTTTLRLFGSEGLLQLTADGLGYQLIDWQGRIVRAANHAGYAANRRTRRSFPGI